MNLKLLVTLSILIYVANADYLIPATIETEEDGEDSGEISLVEKTALDSDQYKFLKDSKFIFIWMCFSSAFGVLFSEITFSIGKSIMYALSNIKDWEWDPEYFDPDADLSLPGQFLVWLF